jgi:hypothetical protein
MRASKLAGLRSAITIAIGVLPTGKSAISSFLPIPPLIDLISEYAIEDLTVTRLVGQMGQTGVVDADDCSGLQAVLDYPHAIAVTRSKGGSHTSKTAKEAEILIADDSTIRLYSLSAGTTVPLLAMLYLIVPSLFTLNSRVDP